MMREKLRRETAHGRRGFACAVKHSAKGLRVRDEISALRVRVSRGYRACGDFVGEGVGRKTVQPAVGCLGLWVHQKVQRRPAGIGKRDILGVVVGDPVSFPGTEQALASLYDLDVVQCE